jgi:GTP-binding protein YchF
MARIGIVGFPNVGKTTLFNALTGLEAVTAAHPYSTTEPNMGVAVVPDPGLDAAAAAEGSKKTVHASLELLDLPSMAQPGHGGGLGAQFVGKLREMEAMSVVLRAFVDGSVVAEAVEDPAAQAEELVLELTLADADVFGRRAPKLAKEATADPSKRSAAEAVAKAAEVLEGGTPLRALDWSEDEIDAFRDMAPLTSKPTIWVVNTGEDEADPEALGRAVAEAVPADDVVVTLSARLEEEGSRLSPEEREELFDGLGLGAGALAVMVGAAYRALGVLSFYTLGPKEAHAWTVQQGATVREAAGKIHSDLERGFIRAEVGELGAVTAAGGWDAAKAAGLVRVEGKEYAVCEGDVILVRFSV